MRLAPTALLLLVSAACGRSADLEGPAPEGALECSLAYAVDAGYQLVDGSPEDGFLRLIQRIAPDPADARPTQPRPDLSDVAVVEGNEILDENELLVEVNRGRLQFSVLGSAEVETPNLTGSTANEQARTMLTMCTSSPPVFPNRTDSPTQPLPPGAPL